MINKQKHISSVQLHIDLFKLEFFNTTPNILCSPLRYSFWDKDARTKLKTSEACEQPITKCVFNKDGQIFAYSVSYDWSKGHEFHNTQKKNYIFLRSCFDDLKSKK